MIMRRSLAFVLALPLLAPAFAHGAPPTSFAPPAERTQDKRQPLQVTVDLTKVDLTGHKLEVKLSRAADKVRIKVFGMSGGVLAEVEKSFGGAAAGTVLPMSWTPSSEEEVAKIEVWGYDTDTFFAGVAVSTWKANVPHEELNFETDSDVIRPGEVSKLEASLQKITDLAQKAAGVGKVTLYVIGHTDTVGSADHNLTLSRNRARAIAAWFKAHGLKIPIAYEGEGKWAQLVKTGDQVDEPRNRRVEYLLSLLPPSLPSAELGWKAP
jgi:outer membrane protein OmpA-like peptidoglycan-associated protein